MDTRRFRKQLQSQTIARVRWFGWVMLMMFVLVQMATGAENRSSVSKSSRPEAASFQGRAEFRPTAHQVTVKARAPTAASNTIAEIGRHQFCCV
jgi:hypothetical protein